MKTIRVATLNIWNRFGPWDERLASIREGVKALEPDLLGLQEVLRLDPGTGDGLDQAAAIGEPFGYHAAYARAHDEPWFGNAALSRWPIAASQTYELPRAGTEERRTLLHADVDSPFGRIPFFVTHLNWKFGEGHVREAQVRDVAARIEAVVAGRPSGGFPAILCGDFNAEPDSDEIRYLRGLTSLGTGRRVYFQDAFGLAGDGSPGTTYVRANPFAAVLAEPDRRIDYVFVHGRDDRSLGAPQEARVCFDRPVGGVYPSDHYGVVTTLRAE
jgi:endonuclease/exonuclease/phosphatase family metal-dependent hydrolase